MTKSATKSKYVRIILWFFGLAFLAGTIYGFVFYSGTRGTKEQKMIGEVIRKDLLQRTTFAGIVTPLKKTVITAPYNGYVKKLYVNVGDKVKQGDPLVSVVQSLQSGDNSFPLRSPLNGIVVQVEKFEGEYAKEGDPKDFILRIDDTSKIFVSANAPEIDRVKIKSGQEAIIKASAILSRSYKGIIREMSLAAREKDSWSRSQVVEFPVRIEITERDEHLKAGMSVVIDVITGKKEKVLTLRHEFIRRENETYFVILGSGERREIKVGMQNEEVFEVVSGLQEGDKTRQVDFSELQGTE
jgi:multidrug efflux pump subunit AcrA (membrane-fusion protein)